MSSTLSTSEGDCLPSSNPAPRPVGAVDASAGGSLALAKWFETEVSPHESGLRAYLRRSLPCMADVDDVVQDTYHRVVGAQGKGRIRSLKPFLFAIARNAVRDFITRRKSIQVVPFVESEKEPELLDRADVIEGICHEQELAILREAIDSLPARCREVVILRKIKGMPQKEIARTLGVSLHTVENQANLGMHKCAEYLRARGVKVR